MTAKRSLAAFFAPALLAALSCGSTDRAHEPARAPDAAAPPAAATVAARSESRLTIPPDRAANIGLTAETATADRSSGEREAYGRVLDPVPLSEQVAARDAARAALVQARSEFARVRALGRLGGNASAREIEAAELALRRSEIDAAAAQERIRSAWGDAVASDGDLPALVRRLSERSAALARVEVPAAEHESGTPSLAALALATTGAAVANASLLGPAPTTDPLTQGNGFVLRIDAAPPAPGSALVARLAFLEEVRAGVRIPVSSVVWADGRPQVWVARGDDSYERKPVSIEQRAGDSALVTGIEPGERIVVTGAAQLLSEAILAAHEAE